MIKLKRVKSDIKCKGCAGAESKLKCLEISKIAGDQGLGHCSGFVYMEDKKMKPVIYNTEMMKAILSGQKLSTRRPVKAKKGSTISNTIDADGNIELFNADEFGDAWSEINAPYQKDNILYVRETCRPKSIWNGSSCGTEMEYRAGGDNKIINGEILYNVEQVGSKKWIPSIHAPKKVSRVFLKVISVRAERVHDITDEEAEKEGMGWLHEYFMQYCGDYDESLTRSELFQCVWDSIYKDWAVNPWVWVYDFKVLEGEIG